MTTSTPETASPADASQPLKRAVAQLAQRLSEQELRVAEAFATLHEEVNRLVKQVDQIPQAAPVPAVAAAPVAVQRAAAPVVAPVVAAVTVEVDSDPLAFIESRERPIAARPVPARVAGAPVASTASLSAAGSDLEELIFGPELSASAGLAEERGELLRDMAAGDENAMTLAGTILAFRGASSERMPQLLKDIGEAWYSWRPETADADDCLRDELTGFLQRKCDEAGVPNAIELVRPGDRYDSKRHHARQPGVEVVSVGGWVVLRDNGKVYTKATVSVK